MLSDVEINKKANKLHIKEIAKKLNIAEEDLDYYGKYKAKISLNLLKKLENKKDGKLILVTSINPTPLGEGKTTVTIGLGEAFAKLNKSSVIALREPSLGPVFGIKGGATGGGYAQVVPMDEINLHFTGDIHAMETANNLICACIDNHIFQGNALNIDTNAITYKRCMDMNDRALRTITLDYSFKDKTFVRNDGFDITVASEIMAILCLSKDLEDLNHRVSEIIFGYDKDGNPLKVKDLNIAGSVTALLKDAINPNLVQTVENTPAIIHGGPFANIAHGCNSIVATKLALKLSDYVITEAGFGADLGAEKFLDIKCRVADLKPNAIVIVATIKALKYNGGVEKTDLQLENLDALEKGFSNLRRHIENIQKYNLPAIVALNKYDFDTDKEIELLKSLCESMGASFEITEGYSKGGEGAINLAKKVIDIADNSSNDNFKFIYDLDMTIEEKIEKVAKEIYGAKDVKYSEEALEAIKRIEKIGKSNLPICIAKTQYSFSDDPKVLGAPKDYTFNIRDVILKNGAGFIVAIAGSIMTMPGLPKVPSAEKIYVAEDGTIEGIF